MAFSDGRRWFAEGYFAVGYWHPNYWAGESTPAPPATAVGVILPPTRSVLIRLPLPTPVNMARRVLKEVLS